MEDEPGIRNALALTLRGAGYQTQELSCLSELDTESAADPFLVLLDISLGKTDAVEVLRRLRDLRFGGAVQLMSGSLRAMLEDVSRVGERYGLVMLPVLRKPFRMSEVRAIAERESASTRNGARPMVPTQAKEAANTVRLGDALDKGWVEVWYQPKYDLRSGSLLGAECLARVRHPELGIVYPGNFLPGASEDDLAELTKAVIRQSFADWPTFEQWGAPLRLAINITAAQLLGLPLADIIRQSCPTGRGWPGLILEITEEEALRDVDAAHEAGTQLGIYGIDLSIDDFGLGYSSLARLRDIPFREIKLDRTLVQACQEDKRRGALCRAVVDLAHTLGAKVVAEGVETPAELSFLRLIGCDIAQGYLLGRPMPKAALGEEITPKAGDRGPSRAPGGLAAQEAIRAAQQPYAARRAPDPCRPNFAA